MFVMAARGGGHADGVLTHAANTRGLWPANDNQQESPELWCVKEWSSMTGPCVSAHAA